MVLVWSISFDYCSITMGLLSMNGIHFILILYLLLTSTLYSRGLFADDTFEFQLDKKAHLGVSFGLYFTFYTLYSDTLLSVPIDSTTIPLQSMLSATIVGFTYELYQSTPHSKSDGFSYHDMVYNMIGIGIGRLTHEVFLYFKEIL